MHYKSHRPHSAISITHMSCTRGTAISLSVSQFVAIILAISYCGPKRPLFVYTTSVSYVDALSSYNETTYTMWFRWTDYRGNEAVNPYVAQVLKQPVATKHHGVLAHATEHNTPLSTTRIINVATFFLFMFPAFLACVYSFSSARLVDSGQVSLDAVYGEHGVKDSLMWEVTFWTLVCTQHAVAQCVLSSPVDITFVAGSSFAAAIFILAFCVIAVNQEGDSASRRFEGPVFIVLALSYLLIVSNSKVVLSQQFTFMAPACQDRGRAAG